MERDPEWVLAERVREQDAVPDGVPDGDAGKVGAGAQDLGVSASAPSAEQRSRTSSDLPAQAFPAQSAARP
jgi:hypothetical protein